MRCCCSINFPEGLQFPPYIYSVSAVRLFPSVGLSAAVILLSSYSKHSLDAVASGT